MYNILHVHKQEETPHINSLINNYGDLDIIMSRWKHETKHSFRVCCRGNGRGGGGGGGGGGMCFNGIFIL